ncbi:hypothetical protein AMS62_01875 [Bacillus sp. FJAT-18019]|nr:hypothetical protein AMS62_01875 [Bacillus sp. FJAT-18019]
MNHMIQLPVATPGNGFLAGLLNCSHYHVNFHLNIVISFDKIQNERSVYKIRIGKGNRRDVEHA